MMSAERAMPGVGDGGEDGGVSVCEVPHRSLLCVPWWWHREGEEQRNGPSGNSQPASSHHAK